MNIFMCSDSITKIQKKIEVNFFWDLDSPKAVIPSVARPVLQIPLLLIDSVNAVILCGNIFRTPSLPNRQT